MNRKFQIVNAAKKGELIMDKQYVITDGLKFIKVNDQGDPTKTNGIALATIFDGILNANHYFKTNKMTKINKENGINQFRVEEVEGFVTSNKSNDSQIERDIAKEIAELDGVYADYDSFKIGDEDNKYIYSGKTYMEINNFDIAEFFHTAIKVFSQLDAYIENMSYLEREIDLKLLDLRHYKRDKSTKLNAVSMQKVGYYEQELERERKIYKVNKIIGSIFKKDITRLHNKMYLRVVDNICNSEYRYRRIGREDMDDMFNVKRKNTNLTAV